MASASFEVRANGETSPSLTLHDEGLVELQWCKARHKDSQHVIYVEVLTRSLARAKSIHDTPN